jgi:hypothetical protein
MAGPRPGLLPRGRHTLDRWQVRREFAVITRATRLGEAWAPRELRQAFVSILSAHGVRIEDLSDLVGHSGTTVTESVYRHEIRPALTTGATAMNKILSKKLAVDRAGQYSIRINRQWRICFSWSDAGPEDVEIVDYH